MQYATASKFERKVACDTEEHPAGDGAQFDLQSCLTFMSGKGIYKHSVDCPYCKVLIESAILEGQLKGIYDNSKADN